MMRRRVDLVELQQIREQVIGKSEAYKQRIKGMFDKRAKADNFWVGDWVLSGMLSDRTRGNMENLTLYGLALLLYTKYIRITPSNCRIWERKRYLMDQ